MAKDVKRKRRKPKGNTQRTIVETENKRKKDRIIEQNKNTLFYTK